jgi:hypothetical protein
MRLTRCQAGEFTRGVCQRREGEAQAARGRAVALIGACGVRSSGLGLAAACFGSTKCDVRPMVAGKLSGWSGILGGAAGSARWSSRTWLR